MKGIWLNGEANGMVSRLSWRGAARVAHAGVEDVKMDDANVACVSAQARQEVRV